MNKSSPKRQFIKGIPVNEYYKIYRLGEEEKGVKLTNEQIQFIQSMVWVKTNGEIYDKSI